MKVSVSYPKRDSFFKISNMDYESFVHYFREKWLYFFLQSHKLDKINRWKCSDVLSATVI